MFPLRSPFVSIAIALALTSCGSTPGPAAASSRASSPDGATGAIETTGAPTTVTIPGGQGGIGFDDLRYSSELSRVLVPGGRAGVVALVDPKTGAVETIDGFSKDTGFTGGHDFGVTSVDAATGLLFAVDRTTRELHVVDVATKKIVSSASLASSPDYVRWVARTRELWVTEPASDQIEIFSLADDPGHALRSLATITVDNGPESLVIDETRGRAYTHRWDTSSVAIDLASREIVGDWKNGCKASRGIALDERRGLLFAICSEGTVSALDVAQDGKVVGTASHGGGFDVVGYAADRGRLYAAGSACKCLAIFSVSDGGSIAHVASKPAAAGTHCAVADDVGNAWFCDPKAGAITRVEDAP